MLPYSWLVEAAQRIAPYIQKTPLTYDEHEDLYLKWENRQVTGSFKARGAFNRVLSLEPWERQRGLVAASAGNHGQGLALAGNLVGAPVTIFASEHASKSKIAAMQSLGADVHLIPGGYGEVEQAGLDYAAQNQAVWVSGYNDAQVIAGQGTIALEALSQVPENQPLTWISPFGGGGLSAGIGCALKEPNQSTQHRLVAAQSEASAFGYMAYHQGSQDGVIELPSLADGLAGPVERGSITLPLAQNYLDDFVLVTEKEIAEAIAYAWSVYNERIEGSAAAALAAALTHKVPERPALVVISGGNIDSDLFSSLIQAGKPPSQDVPHG